MRVRVRACVRMRACACARARHDVAWDVPMEGREREKGRRERSPVGEGGRDSAGKPSKGDRFGRTRTLFVTAEMLPFPARFGKSWLFSRRGGRPGPHRPRGELAAGVPDGAWLSGGRSAAGRAAACSTRSRGAHLVRRGSSARCRRLPRRLWGCRALVRSQGMSRSGHPQPLAGSGSGEPSQGAGAVVGTGALTPNQLCGGRSTAEEEEEQAEGQQGTGH